MESCAPVPTPKLDGSDVFDVPGFFCTTQPTLSLKQPSKWLQTPMSSSPGYCGQLISIENLPASAGMIQTSVHLRKVVTETGVVKRARMSRNAEGSKTLDQFAKERVKEASERTSVNSTLNWEAPNSLFHTDSGITFVESDQMPHNETIEIEPTPSEQSASAMSDVTDVTKPADGELTTVPFLFDDTGTPHTQETNISAFGTLRSAIPNHVQVSHRSFARHSSVTDIFGSRPSSSASESLKNNVFRFYPSEESEVDRLVTKAPVPGYFRSALPLSVRRTVRRRLCEERH